MTKPILIFFFSFCFFFYSNWVFIFHGFFSFYFIICFAIFSFSVLFIHCFYFVCFFKFLFIDYMYAALIMSMSDFCMLKLVLPLFIVATLYRFAIYKNSWSDQAHFLKTIRYFRFFAWYCKVVRSINLVYLLLKPSFLWQKTSFDEVSSLLKTNVLQWN